MNRNLLSLNVIAYIGLIIVNVLALQIPFFGRTPGQVSGLYTNLLTPADFVFRIWSIIYIMLGFFAYAQLKSIRQKDKVVPAEVIAIGPWFVISCFLNISWLLSWQSLHIPIAFFIIFLLWLVLMWIYYKVAHVDGARWQFTLPISIYFGWVCVAALATLNVFFIHLGFEFFGFPEENWTATLIGIGILGTLLMLYLNKDILFTAVLIWAYFGMYIKNSGLTPEGNPVTFMALFAMGSLLLIGTGTAIFEYRRSSSAT